MNPAVYLRFLLLPLAVAGGALAGGWWNYTIPVFCFILHPMMGLIVSGNKKEVPGPHPEYPAVAYRGAALCFVPVLTGVTAFCIGTASGEPASTTEWAGLVLSTGIMNGILGFTLAHEFIHRLGRTERMAGHLLLLQNCYLHYGIEHIGGHHVYACTEQDPHTARLNESIYRFLPRAVAATFRNAWHIESRRLKKKNIPALSITNRMLRIVLLQTLFLLLIFLLAGPSAVFFLLLQAAVAIILLHVTNYLQHYGLMRTETVVGQLEKISTHHAWGTGKTRDGLNLFQLDKHADHHMHPNRSYEQLTAQEDSPEMPAGYSVMILLACLPPLWFRIMNKRIASFNLKHQHV